MLALLLLSTVALGRTVAGPCEVDWTLHQTTMTATEVGGDVSVSVKVESRGPAMALTRRRSCAALRAVTIAAAAQHAADSKEESRLVTRAAFVLSPYNRRLFDDTVLRLLAIGEVGPLALTEELLQNLQQELPGWTVTITE